jgi:hypothetical protein
MSDWLNGLLHQSGLPEWEIPWGWMLAITIATFVGSILAVVIILVKLPAAYFANSDDEEFWTDRHPVLRWTGLIVKNLLGLIFLLLGLIMLITPGQGVLFILMGIMLLNFPGKRRLERKLVGRPNVLRPINRLRARFGKPPLVLEASTSVETGQPGAGAGS